MVEHTKLRNSLKPSNRSPYYIIKMVLLASLVLYFIGFFMYTSTLMTPVDEKVHVVVIGGGLAGLTSSLQAYEIDPTIKILLLEKEPKIGGNSAKASSGINCALTKDEQEEMYQDTIRSGKGVETLVRTLADQSGDALKFLTDHGAELTVKAKLGGHSSAKTYRNEKGPNVGFYLISTLENALKGKNNIDIRTNMNVTDIQYGEVFNGHRTYVVKYISRTDGLEHTVLTESVIMATGGFASSKIMLKRFVPDLADFPTTNGKWATGDGMIMGERLDADLIDMQYVQLHPTGFIDPKAPHEHTRFLCAEALRGEGGVLLNFQGKRFIDELETRDHVSAAIRQQSPAKAFLVLVDPPLDLNSHIGFYQYKGLIKNYKSVKEFAEYNSLPVDTVFSEINTRKKVLNSPDQEAKVFGMQVEPVLHYCMGGVRFNERAQALYKDLVPVDGLYVTGEVSGGLHGLNRLGGNSLAECVVFGRIAGKEVAQRKKEMMA